MADADKEWLEAELKRAGGRVATPVELESSGLQRQLAEGAVILLSDLLPGKVRTPPPERTPSEPFFSVYLSAEAAPHNSAPHARGHA